MGQYNIKDLERLSGIKAHTIRIWEKRYGLLSPERTVTNRRFYTDEDLKRLLNITSLYKGGEKISRIAKMSGNDIHEQVLERTMHGKDEHYFVEQLMIAGFSFDEDQWLKISRKALQKYGLQETVAIIYYPLLERIGVLWGIEQISPAEEHFVTNMVRRELYLAIEYMESPQETDETWLLFTREGDWHDVGLLLAWYMLKKAGKNVIFLGQSVPLSSVEQMIHKIKPGHAFTLFIQPERLWVLQEYLAEWNKLFNDTTLYFSGSHGNLSSLNPLPGQHKLSNTDELNPFLKKSV